MRNRLSGILATILCVAASLGQAADPFPVLKSDTQVGKQGDDLYLLTTSQLLHPWGEQTLVRGRPVDLAFNAAKTRLAVLNSANVLLLDADSGQQLARIATRSTSYTGLAFRPGDREIWASETTRKGPDSIAIATLNETGVAGKPRHLELKGHPVPAGIAFSGDGRTAYVAFCSSNTLAVVDAASQTVLREIPVGMAPFGVAVSEKRGRIFVSNRAGRRPGWFDAVAPSSGDRVVADPRTSAAASGTVSVIDLKNDSVRQVDVGLAPSKIALSPDESTLAVANSHSDSVSLINTTTLATTQLKVPAWPEGTLGSQPVDVRFAPDGRRLYITCAGNNAVAIATCTAGAWTVAGSVPLIAGSVATGWFPSAIEMDHAGNLWVVNIKGVGNTDNGKGAFNARQFEGSLVKMPPPTAEQIEAGTREVRAANSPQFEPVGGVRNLSALGIQHVFFIIKENRTYDQVFGDMPQGNGDPKLVMYGREVSPNHHALAERYVLLDNFYAGGAISFEGHQWLMQAFVSDYVERALTTAPRGYAWNMCDALSVSPAGFFWQGARRPLQLRIFGEFCNPAQWDESKSTIKDIDEENTSWGDYWKLYQEGKWPAVVRSRCGVPAVARFVCDRYPVGVNITDQIRVEVFQQELAGWEKRGQAPNLTVMCLSSDHTMGTKPGAPVPAAMVADNDLALGRVVEAISKSRFWSRSLILVVEDDAQDGVDHVDGHRTVALAIGPYVRRNVVDSNNYTHLSMVRTIQEIFNIPPRTRYLKSARAMNTLFTDEPDLAPYAHRPANIALDTLNPPLKNLKGRTAWAARQSMAMNWVDVDDVPKDLLNRILWWDSKGFNTPYPELRRKSPAVSP
jgi:YVTN family beta-propeller protein